MRWDVDVTLKMDDPGSEFGRRNGRRIQIFTVHPTTWMVRMDHGDDGQFNSHGSAANGAIFHADHAPVTTPAEAITLLQPKEYHFRKNTRTIW